MNVCADCIECMCRMAVLQKKLRNTCSIFATYAARQKVCYTTWLQHIYIFLLALDLGLPKTLDPKLGTFSLLGPLTQQ